MSFAPLDRMTLADALSYLTDDILQKVDRAAMAVALETRVPFLDKDVVEFAARIPPGMKVRDGRGKWLVRQVLYQHVPQNLVDRPKTGFGIPIDDWLRGPLKSMGQRSLVAGKAASPELVQCQPRGEQDGRAHERPAQPRLLALERPDGSGLA